jgi:hypothetical protein
MEDRRAMAFGYVRIGSYNFTESLFQSAARTPAGFLMHVDERVPHFSGNAQTVRTAQRGQVVWPYPEDFRTSCSVGAISVESNSS